MAYSVSRVVVSPPFNSGCRQHLLTRTRDTQGTGCESQEHRRTCLPHRQGSLRWPIEASKYTQKDNENSFDGHWEQKITSFYVTHRNSTSSMDPLHAYNQTFPILRTPPQKKISFKVYLSFGPGFFFCCCFLHLTISLLYYVC